MKTDLFMLIGAVGAILLGLAYLLHAFGPTEAEVVTWGRISLFIGIVLVLLLVGLEYRHSVSIKVILGLGYAVLALLQVLPIFLWFAFDSIGISDGTPPSAFVAHWVYAFPHLVLLSLSLVAFYRLYKSFEGTRR